MTNTIIIIKLLTNNSNFFLTFSLIAIKIGKYNCNYFTYFKQLYHWFPTFTILQGNFSISNLITNSYINLSSILLY